MLDDEWLLSEGDIHVRVWMAGLVFDYAVASTAARRVVRDWQKRRWCTIEFLRDTTEGLRLLPRMPCERLFLGQ
ncbi:hypothetical protein [Nocardia sp. NPDC005745]|uniref:hypothetical protein n=1 Tax=Nocardia sp. NPDC005745 TaxID=3157061 RepID=UPI0034039666